MRRKQTTLLAAGAIVALAASAGAFGEKRQRIDSRWSDRAVVIDGDYGEWAGPLQPIDGKGPIVTAAMNDGRFLYVVLSTSDAAARRQIMRQGLLVWFDPSGGDKKHFGLKFPVGFSFEERAGRRGGYRRGGSEPGDPDSQAPPDMPEPTNRLEVYGPQKDDVHSFVTDQAPGIAVKIGAVEGYLVYELKVPLARTADTPYAVETTPGSAIGFGLETPKLQRPERDGGGGFGGRGMGGRGGGMGGRGGGMGRRGDAGRDPADQPKPLKTWATIQLAKG